MGMVVRTNTMAINAYRQLGLNNNAVSKSLEKLASGYRINRAGDDAAGLAISEKMKAQITGLETASANAQDGISLIQTAEGNLSEVHDMLNRMVELSTKSANGTYTNIERQALQDEMDQLLDEIDRISKSANFNGAKLLDGSLGEVNAINAENIKPTEAQASSTITGTAVGDITITDSHVNPDGLKTAQATKFTIDLADYKVTLDDSANAAKTVTFAIEVDGKTVSFYTAADFNKGTTVATAANKIALEVETGSSAGTTVDKTATDILTAAATGKAAVIDSDIFEVTNNGTSLTFEYKGTIDATTGEINAADKDGDTVKDGTTFVPTGNVEIKKTDGDKVVKSESPRDNCHITNITDPIEGGDVKRAGASLKLTKEIIERGELKIGDTTFKFDKEVENGTDNKTPNAATAGAKTGTVTIGIKGITDEDELLQAVTEQMSHCKVKVYTEFDDDGNGKAATAKEFTVGRGDDTDVIEIEEATVTGTDKFGQYTEELLLKAFSQEQAASAAKTEVTMSKKDGDLVNFTAGNTLKVGDKTFIFTEKGDGTDEIKLGATAADTLDAIKNAVEGIKVDGNAIYTATAKDGKLTITNVNATAAAPEVTYTANTTDAGGLTLQIGDTAEDFNKMTVFVKDMSANGLGLEELKKNGIMTEASASKAIDTIKTAINTVSSTRAGLGALQNRLEHTINNLDVAAENLSSANSRIRDTDMAKEMMNYTKMNVLVQSAQAMLAQANQQPQSVLQLLQ